MSSGPIEGPLKNDQVFRNKINAYIDKSFKVMSALQYGASVPDGREYEFDQKLAAWKWCSTNLWLFFPALFFFIAMK